MLELCLIRAGQDQGPENSRDVFGETSPELLTCRREQSWGREMFLQLPQAWAHLHSAVRGDRDMTPRTTLGAPRGATWSPGSCLSPVRAPRGTAFKDLPTWSAGTG